MLFHFYNLTRPTHYYYVIKFAIYSNKTGCFHFKNNQTVYPKSPCIRSWGEAESKLVHVTFWTLFLLYSLIQADLGVKSWFGTKLYMRSDTTEGASKAPWGNSERSSQALVGIQWCDFSGILFWKRGQWIN